MANKKTNVEEKPKPNISFIGDDFNQPTKEINDGMDRIKLPSVEEQLKNKHFFHEDAARIIQLLPLKYKRYKEKGK